jgi:hypothetical protein
MGAECGQHSSRCAQQSSDGRDDRRHLLCSRRVHASFRGSARITGALLACRDLRCLPAETVASARYSRSLPRTHERPSLASSVGPWHRHYGAVHGSGDHDDSYRSAAATQRAAEDCRTAYSGRDQASVERTGRRTAALWRPADGREGASRTSREVGQPLRATCFDQ